MLLIKLFHQISTLRKYDVVPRGNFFVQTTVFLLSNNIYLSQIHVQPLFAIREGMEGMEGR